MALSLSGTAQYLHLSSALLTATPITYSCWIRSAVGTGYRTIISITSSNGNDALVLYVNPSGIIIAQTKHSGTGVSASSASGISTNTWYHVCAVYASATSRALYVNGVKTTNTTSSTPAGLTDTYIAADYTGSTPWNGTLAFPAIWNVALSDTDVTSFSSLLAPGFATILFEDDRYSRSGHEGEKLGRYWLADFGCQPQDYLGMSNDYAQLTLAMTLFLALIVIWVTAIVFGAVLT